jgi:hypothetical protein
VKKRLTEEQIIGFLREAEAGVTVKEPCRRHGFSKASYDLCRSKYGGMSVPEAKWLRTSYCRPQTLAAMPRRADCGLAPLASHRAMNWGGTSTSRTLNGWSCGRVWTSKEVRQELTIESRMATDALIANP